MSYQKERLIGRMITSTSNISEQLESARAVRRGSMTRPHAICSAPYRPVDLRCFRCGKRTKPFQQTLSTNPVRSVLARFLSPTERMPDEPKAQADKPRPRRPACLLPDAVVVLEEEGAAAAAESAVGHDGHAVPKEIGLVHEVGRQHYHSALAVLADQVPCEASAAIISIAAHGGVKCCRGRGVRAPCGTAVGRKGGVLRHIVWWHDERR